MRDKNVFNIKRCLPRMVRPVPTLLYNKNIESCNFQSWSLDNLYSVWARAFVVQKHVTFSRTNRTLFQQRWTAKALIRAYHGDFIPEKTFKRWYLPATLPDVRPRLQTGGKASLALDEFAGRKEQFERAERRKKKEDEKGLAPVGSLMMSEVERRIDVFMFRCCFASSVYEARRLVIHGRVLLNGKKVNAPRVHENPFAMLTCSSSE